MVKNLSCVSCGSLKRFPHTFTTGSYTRGTSMYYVSLMGGGGRLSVKDNYNNDKKTMKITGF